MVLLLLIYCFMYLRYDLRLSLFWYALRYVLSSFAIVLTRKRELVALLVLCFGCIVSVYVLWLFLMVPCVGLQFVIVVFPCHTHLPFDDNYLVFLPFVGA